LLMISNAGKGIKQVINNIDKNVIVPAIERLYHDNLRYNDDPDIIGDLQVVARGANTLVVKEAEAIRRNEFLQLVLNSPVASQIVGGTGAAELLRDAAKNLNMNVDRIVPDRGQLTTMEEQQQLINQLQQQLQLVEGATQQALRGSQQPSARPTLPDGSPQGGMDGNIARNIATGANG